MTVLSILPSLIKEEFTGELELQLRWDPLPKSTGGNATNLQPTGYDENMTDKYSLMKNAELLQIVSKLSWKDVYGEPIIGIIATIYYFYALLLYVSYMNCVKYHHI